MIYFHHSSVWCCLKLFGSLTECIYDVAIMSRSKNALKDTFSNVEKEARRRGLVVNENKTKYMQVARAVHNDEHLCCG